MKKAGSRLDLGLLRTELAALQRRRDKEAFYVTIITNRHICFLR